MRNAYGTVRIAVWAAALCMGLSAARSEVAIKNGSRVAFLGDSITQVGWTSPTGYVRLVVKGLEANGIKVEPIPAGISGHNSINMLARLQTDVIDKKPDWVTISCGVNDVWQEGRSVPLDTYKENMTAMVAKVQAAGMKVMIMTSTMIGEDLGNQTNKNMIPYNDFLHALAKEKGCLLADLNADMQATLAAGEKAGKKRGAILTTDGIHMNVLGDMMLARGVLKAMGLNDDQLAKAREAWLDVPGLVLGARITLRQYEALDRKATAAKMSVQEYFQALIARETQELPEP